MPRLAVFAACNDVLFDDQANPSLINVFIALEVAHPRDIQVDKKSMAPRPWSVFTMWRAEKDDIGKQFTQKVLVLTPDGEEFGHGSESFTMEKVAHSVRIKVAGFPVGIEGEVIVKVWLEVNGKRVSHFKKQYINVHHISPK